MSAASDVALNVASNIAGSVMPAVLGVLGLLLAFVFVVWGACYVFAILQSAPNPRQSAAYKVGRMFGSLVDDYRYSKYKSRRSSYQANARYRERFKKEKR